MKGTKITYLGHSGFSVETATKVLVFDYFQDPSKTVDAYAAMGKPLWFFVSHWHQDHFNNHIAAFDGAWYILNDGVVMEGVKRMKSMRVYDTIHIDDVTISQYGSTDEGGSFLVRTDGLSVFHAGDLNWWYWLGDTDENNAEADANFKREMAKLDGMAVDLAFFPVDARLEGAREWGVKGFLDRVRVQKALVPMHYFGAPWVPSQEFRNTYGNVPLWIPQREGEDTVIP